MKKIFIAVFLILCLVPSLGMLITGPGKGGANEILAAAPEFGADFLNQCSDYIADRFAFRQELITAWAKLNAGVLNTSVEKQVILGKDGELYYAADYTEALNDDELEQIAQNIKKLQAEAESGGARFIFTIAPDKSSKFPQMLPDSYGPKNGNASRLEKYLTEYEINYVNLFEQEIPYYKTDSHWTNVGAAVAADALIGSEYSKGGFYISGKHTGDLYEMLYPALKDNEDELSYAPGFSYTCEKNPRGGEAMTIHTFNEAKSGKLYCWRDSFGISLYPYLADSFGEAVFSRSTDYNIAEAGDSDIIILEIVERNIGNLK